MALVEVDPSELPSNIQAKLSGQPSPAPKGIDYHQVARTAAEHYGIDPELFINQIRQESGFNTKARSPVGATGIAQIMPATAKSWGVNPNDPVASLDAAAKNMAGYINTYTKQGHDPRTAHAMALAAYNAGPGAVQKYKGVPPYAETQNYVKRIMGGNVPHSAPHGFSGGANFAQSPLSPVPQGQPQPLPDLPTPNLLPGQAVAPIPGTLTNGSPLPAPNRMSQQANQFNQSLLSEASQSMPQISLPTAPDTGAIQQASADRFNRLMQTISGAPTQPQGPGVMEGLGNIGKDISGGLGNAWNTVSGVVTNPGKALNDIGGVISNEARHTQSPLDILGGLGGGAVQGVADILNGISSLPADIGNSYLGRRAYAPALQIPTGDLQGYLQNKGASAFVGQLLPFVAAEMMTGGGATPGILARLGKAAGTGAAFGATMDSHGAGLKGRAESAGNLAALGLGLGLAGEVPGLVRRAINPDHLTQAQIDNVLKAGKSPYGFINGRESGRFDNRAPIQQTRPGVAGEMPEFIARPGVEATPAELQDLTRSFNRRSLGLSDEHIITPKTPVERPSFEIYGPNGESILTGKRGLPTSYEKGLERFGLDATPEPPVDLLRGTALPEGRRPLLRPEQKTEEFIPGLGEKPAPLGAEDVQPVLGEMMKPGTEIGDQPAQDFLERAGYSFKRVKDKSSGTKMMATVIGGRSGLVKVYPGESIGSLASRLGSKGISLADAVSKKMIRENSIERIYDDVTRMMGDTEGAHDPAVAQHFFDRVTGIEEYARRVEENAVQRDSLTKAQSVLSDIDNAVTLEEYTLALEKAYESPLMQNPDPFVQHLFEEKVARAERRFEPAPETPLRSSLDVAMERANLLPDKEPSNLLDFNTRKSSNDLLDFGRVDRSNDLIRDINRAPVGDNLLEFPGRKEAISAPETIQVLGPNGRPIEKSISPTKTPGEGSGEVIPSPAATQPGAGGGEVFHQGQSPEAVTKATQELAQAIQQFGGQLMTIAEAQRFIKENNYPGADHFQNILEAGKNNQRVSVTHTPLDRGGKVTNFREISPFAFEKRPIKGKTEVGNLIKEFSPNGDGINADLGAVRDNLVQRLHDAGVNVAAGEQSIEGKPARTQRKILNKLADKLPIEKRTHVYVHDFNFGDSARPTADGARRLDRITESSLTGKMAEETAQYNNQIAPAFNALNRIANMPDAPPAMKRIINQMASGKVSKNSINELRNVLRNASKEVIEQLCRL